MAQLIRGQTFGALEQITNTKLHNLIDCGSVTGITDADCASSMNLSNSKLANIIASGKVSGSSFYNLASIPSGAGVIPSANLGTIFPTGGILLWPSSTIPTGFVLCDGSELSISAYPNLYAVIGTTFGSGTGTFKVPDLRGLVPVGYKSSDSDFNAIGKTGGAKTHTLTVNEIPSHNHSLEYYRDGGGLSGGPGGGGNSIFYGNSGNTGGGQAHNNLQPYMTLNYIIKT